MKENRAQSPAKVYTWVPGTQYTAFDAERIGIELENLIQQRNHKIDAADVVAAAADRESVLHPLFEWNDSKAAEAYRLTQARYLLRAVQVTIVSDRGKEITTRLTVALEKHDAPGKRSYSTTEYAMADSVSRAEVLQQALRELDWFRQKYAELHELAQVFTAIVKTLRSEDLKNRPRHTAQVQSRAWRRKAKRPATPHAASPAAGRKPPSGSAKRGRQ